MIDRQKIASILRRMACHEHGKKPEVKVIGQSINLTACCDAFQKRLERQIDIEINKQIDDKFSSL